MERPSLVFVKDWDYLCLKGWLEGGGRTCLADWLEGRGPVEGCDVKQSSLGLTSEVLVISSAFQNLKKDKHRPIAIK